MLEMMNFYSGTVEGWVTFRNGKEGVHFDWDGEPYESFARNRAASDIPEGQGHGGISGYPVFYPVDRLQIIQPKPMAEFQANYALVDGGAKVYTTRSYRDDFFNETDYQDLRQRFMSTLNTMWRSSSTRASPARSTSTLNGTPTSRPGTMPVAPTSSPSSRRPRSSASSVRDGGSTEN